VPGLKNLTEQNIVDVPLYTYLDAAKYLHVPVWALLSTSQRWYRDPMGFVEWFRHNSRPGDWVDDKGPFARDSNVERITFRKLASLFVSTAVLPTLLSEVAKERLHPMELFRVFEQVSRSALEVSDHPPLFRDPEWVLEGFNGMLSKSSDAVRSKLLKLVLLHQDRVKSTDGTPLQIFPFSRDPAPDAPRYVAIDPELRFGRPTVKGAPTDVLADRWSAGDSAAELAEDYGLSTEEVEEALRYEAQIFNHSISLPIPPVHW
jgi:uncharacterized protein (DUF433 family)